MPVTVCALPARSRCPTSWVMAAPSRGLRNRGFDTSEGLNVHDHHRRKRPAASVVVRYIHPAHKAHRGWQPVVGEYEFAQAHLQAGRILRRHAETGSV